MYYLYIEISINCSWRHWFWEYFS